MRKLIYTVLIGFCLFLLPAEAQKTTDLDEILYADPTIYVEDGVYYLLGTRNREPLGFTMLESTDLKKWNTPQEGKERMILRKGDGAFGTTGFWAPQIIKENGRYYLAYTANEQVVVAESESLYGPYRQKKAEPVDAGEKNIDPFIFKDDDGKFYLYYVRFDRGNYIWVAEFDLEQGKIKPETLKKCFGQTDAWEMTQNYKAVPIMEGPSVFKKDGVYYLFYSANHFRNIDYAVGYATASTPYGPWTKAPENPIIHRSIVKENGSGHGDIFWDKKQQPYYVYHIHNSDSVVVPRRTRIVPLTFKKNKQTGIYHVTAKENKVIVPKADKVLGNK